MHIALTDRKDYDIPRDADWTKIFQLAWDQGVVALACDGLQKIADAGIQIGALTDTPQGMMLKYSMIGQAMAVEETCKKQQTAAARLTDALYHKMKEWVKHREHIAEMAKGCRNYVLSRYSSEDVRRAYYEELKSLAGLEA